MLDVRDTVAVRAVWEGAEGGAGGQGPEEEEEGGWRRGQWEWRQWNANEGGGDGGLRLRG